MLSLLWSVSYVSGQIVEAKVTKIEGNQIILKLVSEVAFRRGQDVDVTYRMGMLESLIGTYKIVSIYGTQLTAEVTRGVMRPSDGMKVWVYPSKEQEIVNNLFSNDYGKKSAVDVISVKRMLKELGYDPGELNGNVNKQTEDAVRKFQQEMGIKVDGRITPELSQVLYQEINSFSRYERRARERAEETQPKPAAPGADRSSGGSTATSSGIKVDFGDAFDNF